MLASRSTTVFANHTKFPFIMAHFEPGDFVSAGLI
jgi:hypothetical protein